jgi:hypothetical protein
VAHNYAQAFRKSIARSQGLLSLHKELHGKQGKPRMEVSDILRGTMVMTFAALDAVVSDAVAAAIPVLAGRNGLGAEVTKFIKDNPQDVLKCFSAEDKTAALTALIRDKYLGEKSFQRIPSIDGVFNNVLGVPFDWKACATSYSAQSGKTVDVDEFKRKFAKHNERRNNIAHEGDMKRDSTATVGIRLDDVRESVDVVSCVGRQVVAQVKKRCK